MKTYESALRNVLHVSADLIGQCTDCISWGFITADHGVFCIARSQTSSGFELLLEIAVDNKTMDAQLAAPLNLTAVGEAMQAVKVQGSKKTYADLIMAVDKAAAKLDYDSLFTMSLKAFVKKSVYQDLQSIMSIEIKKQLSTFVQNKLLFV